MADETPSLDEIADDDDLVKVAVDFVRESLEHFSDWRKEARENYAFVSGDQWDEEDKARLREQMRPVITFNRTGPVLDAVSGWEVSNRQEVRYIPRNEGDAAPNEILTGAADWVRDECDAEDEESDAFMDMLVTGLGCTETRMDYGEDDDGKIVIERVDPLEMRPDPKARKRNLGDAKRIARVRDVDREYFKARWPDKIDDADVAAQSIDESQDQDPHENDPKLWYSRTAEAPPKKNQYRVIEYQWREGTSVIKAKNPQTGAVETISTEDFKTLKERMPDIEGVPIQRYVYKRCFVANGILLEKGENPCKTGFTYKFMTGKRDRNSGTWYGLVRPMKDPQRWANKFFSSTLHHFNTAGKGILARRDAFDNPREAEDRWASADSIVWVKSGVNPSDAAMQKPYAPLPPGLEQLMTFTLNSFREVTGVNLEMMGMADRQQAGVLEFQRRQAGLTILATLFDSLRRYRKEHGRLLLEYIQRYLPDGTLVRVTAGSGLERYIPLVKQAETVKFDVVVDTSPTSPNQKEATWTILAPMLPAIMKMNPPPELWPVVLEASPLPESMVQKVNQVLMQPRQPQPDPAMVKAQADIQAKQAELQLKAQDAERTAAMELQKLQAQMEMKRMEADLDMQIAVQKANTEMQIAREKAAVDLEVRQHSAAVDQELKARDMESRAEERQAKGAQPSVSVSFDAKDAMSTLVDKMAQQNDRLAVALESLAKASTAKRRVKTPRGEYVSETIDDAAPTGATLQ